MMTQNDYTNSSMNASIFVSGDFVPLHQAGTNLAAGKIESVFGTVLPVIRSCDLAVTNLETAVTLGGEAITKCGPNLKIDPAIIPATVKAGFSLFTVANNHIRDWGDDAFLETLKHVTGNGASYVGGGINLEDAEKPFRITLNGIRVSVFNTSMHTPNSATWNTPGANVLRPARLAAQIAAEKALSDFILVIVHDGKEHVPYPSARIRDNYRGFIDAGAHAVIAHHPHIAQGYEKYHNGLIAYSLGNFQFPARNKETASDFWTKGYSVKLNIQPGMLASFEIIPHFNDPATDCINLMEGEQKKAFLERLDELNKILSDDQVCDRNYTAEVLKMFPNYRKRLVSDTMVYWACVMGTEEHVDLLNAASWELAFGQEKK